MYIRQDNLVRVFYIQLGFDQPQDTEVVLEAVREKLKDIAVEIVVESPLLTYDRDSDSSSNVVLSFFLHLSNPTAPDRVRLSQVTDLLSDSETFLLIAAKLD